MTPAPRVVGTFDTRMEALLGARSSKVDVDVLEVDGRWMVIETQKNRAGERLPPRACKRCRRVVYDGVFGVCGRCRRKARKG